MRVHVRDLQEKDVEKLYALLAPGAELEVLEAGATSALKIWNLIKLMGNEAYVGLIDNKLVCAYGVTTTSIASSQVTVWMLVTTHAMEHPLVFIRHSQQIIARLREKYANVRCHVNTRFHNHQRWIKLLGFHATGMVKTETGTFCEYKLRAN